MMMNFLDLSAASEEERRLIREILSDTSVINIAEPQQFNSNQQAQQQQHHHRIQHHINHEHQQTPQQQPQIPHTPVDQLQQPQKQKQLITNIRNGPIVTSNTTTTTTLTTPTINDSPSIATTSTTHPVPPPPSIISQSNVNNTSGINNHSANTLPNNIYVTSTQPPGYAIPPHVTAFGPPHHVYGGPPLFHPPYHYIIPYNIPQCVPYVLPPNSVVPTQTQTQHQSNTRQQAPPQLNRQNANTTTSSSHLHSRYRHNLTHHNNHQQHQIQQSQQQRQQRQQQQQHHHNHNQSQQQQQTLNQQHQSQSNQIQLQPPQLNQTQSQLQNQANSQQSQRQHPQQKLPQSQQNQLNNPHQTQPHNDPQQRTQIQVEQPRQQPIQVDKPRQEQPKQIDKPQQEQPQKEQPRLLQTNQQQLQTTDQYNTTNDNTSATTTGTTSGAIATASSTTTTTTTTTTTAAVTNTNTAATTTTINTITATPSTNINNNNNTDSELNNSDTKSIQSKTSTTSNNATNQTTNDAWASASSKSWADLFKRGGAGSENHLLNGDAEHNNSGSENSDIDNKVKMSNQLVNNTSGHSGTSKEQRSQEAAKRALDKMALRFAQKLNTINLKHSLPFIKPRGFINKGNGCYINATLQALIACPPFYNLMKEIGDLRGYRRENSCTPIIDSFAELFINFPPLDAMKRNKQSNSQDQKSHIDNLQAPAIEPKCIYNVLGLIKSECLKGAQEDAEEFLSSVLNGLHEEMIGLSEIIQSNQDSANHNGNPTDIEDSNDDIANDDNLWREVGPKNRSLPIRTAKVINTPIQEIFGGSLFSIRTAGKDRCGHRSPFFDLQLDISGDNVKTVQDAIKSFTTPEIIHDFYCSKTKQKLDAQRRTSLDQLPPILILHLKQFVYKKDEGLKKLIKKIEYPIDFELPDVCLHEKNSNDKSLRTSRSYKLLAVVYHDGKEAIKGHYLTDVYHIGSSQWIRCDDSNLKVISSPRSENPDNVLSPYLLFYRRLNTLRAQPGNKRDP